VKASYYCVTRALAVLLLFLFFLVHFLLNFSVSFPIPVFYISETTITSTFKACEISGFCRGAHEVFALLGCYVALIGICLQTFRKEPPWPTPEDETDMLFRNIGKQLSNSAAKQPRKTQTWWWKYSRTKRFICCAVSDPKDVCSTILRNVGNWTLSVTAWLPKRLESAAPPQEETFMPQSTYFLGVDIFQSCH
jgi:hypothetical protein